MLAVLTKLAKLPPSVLFDIIKVPEILIVFKHLTGDFFESLLLTSFVGVVVFAVAQRGGVQFICCLVLQVALVGSAEFSLWSMSNTNGHSIFNFRDAWRIYLFVGGLLLQILDACYFAGKRKARSDARKCASHHNSRLEIQSPEVPRDVRQSVCNGMCRIKTISTHQVAKKMGLDAATLSRYIKAGKITAPPETMAGGIKLRLWSESDIERLREALPKIRNGGKPGYQELRAKQKTQAKSPAPRKPKK